MKKSNSLKIKVIPFALLILFCLGPGETKAQERFSVSGKGTAAFKQQERSDIGDQADHKLGLAESEGVNLSTGETPFMDGAYFDSFVISDLVQYSGPFQGYFRITRDDATIFARFQGQLSTSLDDAERAETELSLDFIWVKGTGPYENIRGGGTMTGRYISNIIYTFEWQGEYWIADQ